MDMGQHGYSMAMLNPWCPVPSTSHAEPWKYHGALWKPYGVPWCTGSHPWCAMENLWCPMESPWCFMENPRDTMEYFCKGNAPKMIAHNAPQMIAHNAPQMIANKTSIHCSRSILYRRHTKMTCKSSSSRNPHEHADDSIIFIEQR